MPRRARSPLRPSLAPVAGPVLALVAVCLSGACGGDEGGGASPAPAAADGWPVALERRAEAEPGFERVVLVTLDTLRADHVSSYGYPRETTPFLDSLAARGARFTRAIASYSCTAPSHATMLTGLVPAVHGVRRNGDALAPEAQDLARLFGAADFETAAVLHVKFLSAIAGSFDHVEVVSGSRRAPLSGADVVDAALTWLRDARTKERFLLWVHLYDVHEWQRVVQESVGRDESPWSGATPPDFQDRVARLHGLPAPIPGQPWAVGWAGQNGERKAREDKIWRPELYPLCVDAYDAQTRFADHQVERLHEGIEALGLPGRTLWIVTADHGEGLGSHGVAGHSPRVYQEQLHVPLVLHASDGSIGPRVVDELVSHADLLPTLAATLGLEPRGDPELYGGHSLWPLLRGEARPWEERTVFSQRCPAEPEARDQDELMALQDGRRKLLVHASGTVEFFDLATDPVELENLGPEAPGARELRAALERRLARYARFEPIVPEAEMPEEWLEELRDLGYAR